MVLLEMSRSRLDELFSHIQSLENARFELLFKEHSIAVWGEGTFSEKAPLQRTVPLGSGFTLLFAASGLRHEMTLTQALLTTIPWILFFCTVVFFLFRLIARRLYQTVAQLSSSISSIDLQSGQLVQPTRYTELNNIVEHFNSMLTHIRRKFSDELQARDKERVLSLQMLESQINPHFLYNSLDVINWLAWQEGAEDVAAMARSLGSFYRDALSKTTNENSLRNEMEHVNTYLEIMNHRISDIPRITIDIPEELMNNVLPRLSLQPLLENALQHGILNRKSAPGTILLCVRREKEALRIAVRDDGPGLSEEKLKKEIDDLAKWPPVEMHGLVNIHHRTRLLYGEQYGLSLFSEENRFFEAVLTVPRREFKPSAPFSDPDQ